jgi:hypothetical protein
LSTKKQIIEVGAKVRAKVRGKVRPVTPNGGFWRLRIREEANRARSEAAREQPRTKDETGKTVFGSQVVEQVVPPPEAQKVHKDRMVKSEILEVGRGAVQRGDFIAKSPELAARVMSGEMPATAAIREIRRKEIIARLEDTAAREVKAVRGVYDVIVIDPPWPMQKIERDARPNQAVFDYPTMTEEELAELPIPAADSCHLWLWTTQKFLPMALRLLDAWEFRYVCQFVWHKPGGFQPIYRRSGA